LGSLYGGISGAQGREERRKRRIVDEEDKGGKMLFFSHGDGDLSDIGYNPLSNRLMTTGEKFEAR